MSLVNATSVGLGDPDAMVVIDVATLRPGLVVSDVIVAPSRRPSSARAREAGATALDGVGMMVGRGP